MTKNAVLVFLPMSGIGDFLPMVNVAKRLMDLNSNLFTAVLFMDEDEGLNQTVSAEFDSVSGRTKFINLPPPPLVDHKDTPLVERAVNLAKAMKPSIIEAVTNIVRDSTSPQLAGFVLDKFYTPLTNDLANEFRVPTYLFYTSNAAALGMDLYMQALHDDDDQKLNLAELQDSEIDEFNRLSSLPPIPYEFFPPALQNLDIFHSIHIHRMKNHSKEVKGTAESEIDEFNRLSSLPPIPYELFPSSLLNLDIFRKIHIHRMNNHSKEVKGTTESEITFNIKEVKGKAESEIEPYSLSPTPYDFSPPVLQNLENFHKIHRMKNHSKEVKGKAESEIEKEVWPMGGDHKEPEIVNAIKIERGIRRLMEQNTEVRKRVKEMSDKSRKVLMEGGSSYSNLCRFINDVMDNMP
ncbi:UDP-glucuronosyl/UDP-glucosyltransferase [Corchorus olitorius]|uniref:UDP-glucuronosyl/UDP-glucosyltransferase n=1 Tax=Corchorus olitorius TaxID=93759 RepID=A0A1R3J2F6_9ROSI|nr:UDP-glucuronosyl/UDP-glucosyltransferase [Corchorus olitorius]